MATGTAKGKTILIVEDDEVARQGLTTILQMEGYQTACAADGQEGIEYLKSNPLPDVILLDMLMGEHDGWEFLDKHQADPAWQGVPIILMTIGVTTREWAIAHGCCGFIPKPIHIPVLLTEIQRCLELARY
jgi:CheY-like chemotaxis protein